MVVKDYSRDKLFDSLGLVRLKESYMRDDETSPQDRFAFVSEKFGSNPEHAQRLYDYSSKHWLSYSTPILAFGKSKKGFPISCFLPYMEDTSEGLVNTLSETNWLSMMGGGVGIGMGIRSADDLSVGVLPHLKIYDASSLAYKQGKTRRGSYAMYLDINHPDIEMFIDIRKPTGDPNMRAANLHHGINVSDEFMKIIEKSMIDSSFDDTFELKDPNGKVKSTISARYLWQKILEVRMHTGEPYLHFIDTSNRNMPEFLKRHGLSIKQSNLCSEITLPTDKERTAVCCLSSLNMEYADEWLNEPLFLRDVLEMLDNVLQYFIDNAPDTISRAKYSAFRERSVGVGMLGFHSYLQQKNIAFESLGAISINNKIFRHVRQGLDKANRELAIERGEAPDTVGTGLRFSHVMAIAPNASTSIIMGNVSPSIEPYRANIFRQDTLSGASSTKNKYLNNLLIAKCKELKLDIDDVWRDIGANDGSVQHLEFLSEHEKNVFKTALEIDQLWIIKHAADRQKFIDQGQSINIFFSPTENIKTIHNVHFQAWKKGLKALYYCRSDKIKRADKLSVKIERKIIEEQPLVVETQDECKMCEG